MDTALAPGYVRVTYDGVLFPHHMVIPVNIDGSPTPGVEPDLILKDASTVGAETAIGDMIDLIIPFYNTGTHFGLAEVHTVDPDTGDDQFIYAWNLGKLGTAVGANVPTVQMVMTFKTVLGGLYRLYQMENVSPPNTRVLPPFGDPSTAALADFITGDSSPVYGRGNAYPFAPISLISKYNDKLRKQQGLA